MKSGSFLLSIIVPIYNTGDYLRDCIDSLLSQNISKDEYEIILVNDGSTDNNTNSIIQEYNSNNENIRVINKENGGVSSARNLGIKSAVGEYIWFIDSDDCIRANCLNSFKKIITKYVPEFIRVQYKPVASDFVFFVEEPLESFKYNVLQMCRGNSVCTTIIRADIIKNNNILFNEKMKYGEDTLFSYYVYTYRKGETPSIFINKEIYYYRTHKSSATNEKSLESYKRETLDYILMAQIYQNDYNNCITDDLIKHSEIKKRQYQAIRKSLLVLPRSSLKYKDVMNNIESQNLYPFPFDWKEISNNRGFKSKVIAFVEMMFKYRFFYRIYYLVFKKRK